MTDSELVAKKLAFIATCLRELRSISRPACIADDVRERRFVEHTLQIAIQAVLDVASHVISDERLGEPHTNREMIATLTRAGWLPQDLTHRLAEMVGFRNVLVHGYTDVDPAILRDAVENRLEDLEAFVDAVRSKLAPG